MTLRIYGPEMYLEIARTFARAKVAIDPKPDLQTPSDLPIATQLHIQLAISAVTIIFSVSYLEAHVNRWLDCLLNDQIDLTNLPPSIDLTDGIRQLKEKYPTDIERNKLFGRETLTEKIKRVYKTLGTPLPFDSGNKDIRLLWERLIKLQDLRNELIHLKPEFLSSSEFKDYLGLESADLEEVVRTPTIIAYLMSEQLPMMSDINLTENAILSGVCLTYADKPFFENLMLGMQYSAKDKQKYMRRQPPRP